ncbi:MAG: hypothetical protein ACFFEN_02725 [Candidatus Thorarchaeota archaeon]
MRDPKEVILKKIHNSFLMLSIATAIFSTVLAFSKWYASCPACATCECPPLNTLGTYISMLSISTTFLIISIIVYVVRRIIITRPSLRIAEEKKYRQYK